MYRVLLADDEKLDLDGMLAFIPWKELGLEVVKAVTNGFDACEVLASEAVDILVTDVRMPNMTGLDLARRALEMNEAIRIIFVSGYQDFSYVKQALSLNVVNYVLKPMDDQELVDTLIKVRETLDQERERQETYGSMEPIVKNQYLLQLLEGSIDDQAFSVLNTEYGLERFEWPGRVAVVELDSRPAEPEEGLSGTKDRLEQVIEACLHLGAVHICKMNGTRAALLLERTCQQHLPGRLMEHMRTHWPFTVTVGLGGQADSVSGLSRSWRQAVESVDLKMFYGKGRVIGYNELRPGQKEDALQLDARLEALFLAMSNYELVQIHDELAGLFEVARSLRSTFSLRNYSLYILMRLDQYLQRTNENVFQLLGMELENYDIIERFETIADIHRWLRRRVYEISETLHSNRQKKNWRLIQQLIGYLREHTAENITLRKLAEQFSISPNYLGVIFKEETGHNFSEYFIQLRMEQAGELLKTTQMKVYEIADRVGYRHLPYFSRQFKETYGMTPLEYRRS